MTVKEKISIAISKGYTIDDNGNVFGPKGQLKTWLNEQKRYVFSFKHGDKVRSILVHRFQSYKKFGDKVFEKGIQTRHLNNNSMDNSWTNIGIGTGSENMMDTPEEIRIARSSLANRKHSDEFIAKLKELHLSGHSYNKISDICKISKSMISYYLGKGETKRHVRLVIPEGTNPSSLR